MIIETIFSTLDAAGTPNFAPMGILWGDEAVTVRPYRDTQTFRNLLDGGAGVAAVTDDVAAYVRSALYGAVLGHFPAEAIRGVVFEGACSWRELEVIGRGGTPERASLQCRVVHTGRRREFPGFCRAAAAVVEAAIVATRLARIGPEAAGADLARYGQIVEKTGGAGEREAMRLVLDYIRRERHD